ncbi:sigma-70 family RNA polymerase sigma factor [Fuerstiella marisgermanici]|uniref:Sigma-24 n=1 Tax=Fuerstiella marisgermanici TaxID=1891926 RepID=A0A1P8WP44_9PLAN|nr:sigma-70 family RNA polymerase sigma factor [Fuerstiella marisgermanici]APZ95827.1 Sigma-24 [Fuerstiella marisgermanici]
MSESAASRELLQRAREGDQAALGELLNAQNRLLQQMAQQEVNGRLQARLSAADIVQQTCLSAIRNFNDFQGDNEPQFAAWLKEVHERNVRDVVRRHVTAKKRAISAQQATDEKTLQADSLHTPSRKAMLDESTAQLLRALDSLPEMQAEAVRLRHLEQLSLTEIAERMDRSDVAVASLLKRGLAALRERLPGDSE